jgi:DNA-binding MarR family transcriptional regulator
MNATDNTRTLKDPLAHFLSYQLRRAAFVTLSALVESLAGLGSSVTEAIVIRFVHANPGCTQADIGRAIGVKRTNMVPIVNGLMLKRLLERTAADGRSHSLYLTVDGRELHRKIVKVGRANEEYFFGDVSEDTRQDLMNLFQSLRAKGEARDERPRAEVKRAAAIRSSSRSRP